MLQFIPLLLQGAVDIGSDFLKRRQERKQKKQDSEDRIQEAKTEATIDRIKSGDVAAMNMDYITVKDRGWKDDYLLLIVTTPMVLSFFPQAVPFITEGFVALNTTPEWYRWLLLGVYIDTFGFRRILREVLEAWLKKRFN